MIESICVGMILYPRPKCITASRGSTISSTMPMNEVHPAVCLERNDTHGLWLLLTTMPVNWQGVERRPISMDWKLGSKNWMDRRTYLGEVSFIAPHDVVIAADERNGSSNWISQDGCEKLFKEHEAAGGITLAEPNKGISIKNFRKSEPKSLKQEIIQMKQEIRELKSMLNSLVRVEGLQASRPSSSTDH